nr:T9SS type A sorting domain-containing protein [Hymenobacter ruricola]
MHPNPADGSAVVDNLRGPVQLYNAQGRLVELPPASTTAPTTLDTRALPSGLYYVTGRDAYGRPIRRALQVQH